MADAGVWQMIHAERAALAADLDSMDERRWTSPSLCGEWTVRDVLAHMTATAKISAPGFFGRMITSGFNLNKVQAKDIAAELGNTPSDTLAGFKAHLNSTKHPPGPTDSWLGETIVHSEDIRRPLSGEHRYPPAAVTRVADFYTGSNLIISAKKRISGLKLTATDTDWTFGDGPDISGPILSLVLAMTGRKPALADLAGDGVATLSSRP